MARTAFPLNLDETFPRLARPPIAEAVIHWTARAQRPLDSESLRTLLATKLPEYRSFEPLVPFEFLATLSGQDVAPVVPRQQGWHGFRFSSDDGRDVVQFKRDGISFSRVKRYDDWDQFTRAAMRVWQTFVDSAEPSEIQRLGVRFINHLTAATPATLHEFLREPPTCPANLPLKDFVYQITFDVPEQPFGIRLLKIMQPETNGLPQSEGLFLDCDVFTTRPLACDPSVIDAALTKMRWLKNKVFFTLLTEQAVQSYS